jgi:hypothetical protein
LGSAGTGKSYVIDALRTRYPDKILLFAPTGKAASNIDGMTLHSFFHIPVGGKIKFQTLKNEQLLNFKNKLFSI